jgi:hypothetical protein
MRPYCHERDQVFGATRTAFSVKWPGVSQCNPEYEHDDMEKAVRWALNSALKSTAATLTLCVVLPAWGGNSNTAYNRVVADHPVQCHVIMRIPKRNFKVLHGAQRVERRGQVRRLSHMGRGLLVNRKRTRLRHHQGCGQTCFVHVHVAMCRKNLET